jgi:hypothetical protein
MKSNVGTVDRVIRLALGIALLYQGVMNGQFWGYLGAIPFVTGAIGWCPLFSVFGIATSCKANSCCCSGDAEIGEAE